MRASTIRNPIVILAAASVLYAIVAAARVAWTCDDAFIAFRYAEQLTRGLGLVFNPGERVEGYSCFLWTLWIAAGMRLRVDPETWSIVWGIAFYAGTVALLALRTWRARLDAPGGGTVWPVAAVLAAVHPDWNHFATSGLETSLDTFLVTLSFMLLTPRRVSVAGTYAAGVALALVAMCRPDGPVFAAVGAAFVTAMRRPKVPHVTVFLAAFFAIWGPYTLWRIHYYGDFFPNTYYAKSAALAWYKQGLIYVSLYFQKYWIAILGLLFAAGEFILDRSPQAPDPAAPVSAWRDEVALAASFALVYTLYVVRVGGDFMFARFMIPVTPLYLVLLEIGLSRLGASRGARGALATAAALVAMLATPGPIKADQSLRFGIANEPDWYPRDYCADIRRQGENLATKYFHDLPVCMAFTGMQARLVFYAKPRTAIETTTGLTDRFIARQPLAKRGRIGHEKTAPAGYVVGRRHADLLVHLYNPSFFRHLGLFNYIPTETIRFDDTSALLLCWDPALIAEFRRRGAQCQDFPAHLDSVIAGLDQLPDSSAHRTYEEAKHFYFALTRDSTREGAFRRRLAHARSSGT